MPEISSSSYLNRVQVPAASAASSVAAPRAASDASRLGKSDFLKLLMAQLSNQDPMKPMDDSQMIAQMAQFSALEETQHLSQVIQQTSNMSTIVQSSSLIGKYVQAGQADGTFVSGMVSNVNFESTDGVTTPTLTVDGKIVNYSDIRKVSSTPITG
jgi:flagellar basal-body rod modification protein FlgD